MWYHSRKHYLNEGIFSNWSAPMAYVLGFWFADGTMMHIKSYRIRFSSKDIDHLEIIKKTLSSGSPVYVDSSGPIFAIHSKQVCENLVRLGGTPNKSNTMTFPEILGEFIADFIRGYFDGDGSVHSISYIASKNGKRYTQIRSNFTSGSIKFLESLKRILTHRLGLFDRKICQYGPHQFKLGYGQSDTFKLLNFMYYPGHPISLKRKAVYLKYLSEDLL